MISNPTTPPQQVKAKDALLESALAHAAKGLWVFPLSPGSKIPHKGSGGFQDATADANNITEQWEQHPGSNVAIATGINSGVFVVDVDMDTEKGKDGMRTLAKLEKQHGKLPTTYTVQTPRGGRHFYFKMPDEKSISSGTNVLGECLDVRGDGGYVVAPPSKVSGKPYKVLNSAPPADPPQWLVDELRRKPTPPPAVVPSPPVVDRPDEARLWDALTFCTPDNYDEWLRVGMALKSWDAVNGLKLWHKWSQGRPDKYDAAEIESKWNSFDGGAVTVGTIFHLAQKGGWTPSTEADPLPDIVDASVFVAVELPEPPQVIHGLLHQGSKLSLGGSSKSYKTWSLTDLAISVAHGVPWWTFPTTQGRVLYVNFEIQDFSWQQRLQAVAKGKGITIEPGHISLWNLRGKAADHNTLLPRIEKAIKGQGYSLIVIDPIYKLYGSTDENAAGDVADLMNGFERLAVETGAAVAFGAHFSKGNQSAKESIDRVSGSGVFARDPDSLLVMTKHEEENAFTLECTLRNFPQVEPFVLRWDFPLMCPDNNLDPARLKQAAGRKPTSTAADLLDLIQDKPLTTAEWRAKADSEQGVSKSKFFRLLSELTTQGKAVKTLQDTWKPTKK